MYFQRNAKRAKANVIGYEMGVLLELLATIIKNESLTVNAESVGAEWI
jgi:hypothetical protein